MSILKLCACLIVANEVNALCNGHLVSSEAHSCSFICVLMKDGYGEIYHRDLDSSSSTIYDL